MPVHDRLEAVPVAFRRGSRLLAGRNRAEIVTGAEGLLARAGEHRHPHVGIGVGLLDRLEQLAEARGVEPVVLGRIVEGDGGARAVDGQQNCVGHGAGN